MIKNGRLALAAGTMMVLAALACNAPERTATPGLPPTPYQAPTLPGTAPPSQTEPPAPPTTAPPTDAPPPPPTTNPPPPPTTTPSQSPPTGALIDFENWGTWRRGDQPNGTFEQSSEQVKNGSFAGKLSYDFPTAGNDFVVFTHPTAIPGSPDRIRAWVYGDGSGHFLNVWIRDAEDEVWQATFGQVDHTGWQRMTAEIQVGQDWPWCHISGPENGAVDYPIAFYGLALDDGNDGFSGSGVIFVDEITAP